MSSSNAFQPRIEFNLKRRMSKWKVEQQQCSGRCFLLGLIPSNPCFHLHKAATVEQGRETQLILISEILQARQHRDCGNTHRVDCFLWQRISGGLFFHTRMMWWRLCQDCQWMKGT